MSVMASTTVISQNVSFREWKRLPNCPEPLEGATAVQWKDLILILTTSGNVLLYHVRHNMWTQIPNAMKGRRVVQGCPMAVYDGQVLALAFESPIAPQWGGGVHQVGGVYQGGGFQQGGGVQQVGGVYQGGGYQQGGGVQQVGGVYQGGGYQQGGGVQQVGGVYQGGGFQQDGGLHATQVTTEPIILQTFHPNLGKWKEVREGDKVSKVVVNLSSNTKAALIAAGDSLSILFTRSQASFVTYYHNSQWSGEQKLSRNIFQSVSDLSVASSASQIFVCTSTKVYGIPLPSQGSASTSLTVTQPTIPQALVAYPGAHTRTVTPRVEYPAAPTQPRVLPVAVADLTPQHVTPSLPVASPAAQQHTHTVTAQNAPPVAEPPIEVTSLTPPPLHATSLSVVEGSLFAFGGRDTDYQPYSEVYKYDEATKRWEYIERMTSSRYGVVVVPFKQDSKHELFIVCGYLGCSDKHVPSRITECCKVELS